MIPKPAPDFDWNTDALVGDFIKAAALAGVSLGAHDITVKVQRAPHIPSSLPAGKMAVYAFFHNGRCLKVGKAGPKSGARYLSQHYNPDSAGSNLAKSLLGDASAFGGAPPDRTAVGGWIRAHCDRVDFLLGAARGMAVLTLLEAFIQCRLRPKYEGFKGQQA